VAGFATTVSIQAQSWTDIQGGSGSGSFAVAGSLGCLDPAIYDSVRCFSGTSSRTLYTGTGRTGRIGNALAASPPSAMIVLGFHIPAGKIWRGFLLTITHHQTANAGAAANWDFFYKPRMSAGLFLVTGAAGVRSTGIGCYIDDLHRRALGLTGHDWQSFYHFTIGAPVKDLRLRTLHRMRISQERFNRTTVSRNCQWLPARRRGDEPANSSTRLGTAGDSASR